MLYKFGIEDSLSSIHGTDELTLRGCLTALGISTDSLSSIHDTDELTADYTKSLLKLMPVLGLYDSKIDFLKALDAKKMLFLAVSNLYWKTPDEYEKLTQQTCRNIRVFHNFAMSKESIFSEKGKEIVKSIESNHIVKLLNGLTPNERAVALTVFKSEDRITRNEIAEKTGLDKRLVTRYARELIKKEIIKNIEKKTKKKSSKKIIKVDYYFWAEPVDVIDQYAVEFSEEEIRQKLLQKLKQQIPL